MNREGELGNISPGFAADIAIFDLNTIEFAGAAVQDPLGALMMCSPTRAKFVLVNGKVVVRYGQIATVHAQKLVERLNEIVRKRFR